MESYLWFQWHLLNFSQSLSPHHPTGHQLWKYTNIINITIYVPTINTNIQIIKSLFISTTTYDKLEALILI